MSFPTWMSKNSVPFSQYLFPPTPFYASPGNESGSTSAKHNRSRRLSTSSSLSSASSTAEARRPGPRPQSSSIPFTNAQSTPETTPSSSPLRSSSVPSPPSNYLTGNTSFLRCGRCSTHICLTSQIISKGFTGRHGRAYLVCPSTGSLSHSTHNDAVNVGSNTSSSRSSTTSLPNTTTHRAVPRQLVTGAHTVSDISCAVCAVVLGWKYVAAEDEAQRYKIGKFILETRKVCVAHFWEEQEDEVEEEDETAAANEQSERASGVLSSGRGVRGGRAGGSTPRTQDPSSVSAAGVYSYGATPSSNKPTRLSRPLRGVDKDRDRDRAGAGTTTATTTTGEIQFDSQDEEECDDLFAGVWSPALATRRRSRRRFGRGD
ncbi:MAG: hypothetical protein M1815_000948 [Lichina confinis]|nr:MAG: hypothetical protein M1815_000948 [Lichina confinis]